MTLPTSRQRSRQKGDECGRAEDALPGRKLSDMTINPRLDAQAAEPPTAPRSIPRMASRQVSDMVPLPPSAYASEATAPPRIPRSIPRMASRQVSDMAPLPPSVITSAVAVDPPSAVAEELPAAPPRIPRSIPRMASRQVSDMAPLPPSASAAETLQPGPLTKRQRSAFQPNSG